MFHRRYRIARAALGIIGGSSGRDHRCHQRDRRRRLPRFMRSTMIRPWSSTVSRPRQIRVCCSMNHRNRITGNQGGCSWNRNGCTGNRNRTTRWTRRLACWATGVCMACSSNRRRRPRRPGVMTSAAPPLVATPIYPSTASPPLPRVPRPRLRLWKLGRAVMWWTENTTGSTGSKKRRRTGLSWASTEWSVTTTAPPGAYGTRPTVALTRGSYTKHWPSFWPLGGRLHRARTTANCQLDDVRPTLQLIAL